ncbi:hypothetical protein [Paenibacillus sp. MMS18-CY102]|nr:hypothetical protein [Paenibacillus sp. MMS18-CY102]
MARNKEKSFQGKQQAMKVNAREAENNTAASTADNRNQKGHIPNSPSTG